MVRIFASLALFAVLLLIVDLAIGFAIGDFNQAAQRLVAAQREIRPGAEPTVEQQEALARAGREFTPIANLATLHRMLGIVAALVTVLVNSVSITYFIGTSRWCREVVDAYHLDPRLAQRSLTLKRKTFPWSLIGILMIIVISAIGAAGDPGITVRVSFHWIVPHMITSLAGTVVIALAFLVQIRNLARNYRLIDEILDQVQRARAQVLA